MPLRCVPAKINCLLLSGISTIVGEIEAAMDTPLHCMFKQLPICDFDVDPIKYHAIEISSLLYNCPL